MAAVDVWAAHFGLSRTPFTKTIPANKLFERAGHSEAVARIHYCINQAALGVIVGDTGAGKTVAVRAAVTALDRTKFTLVYLSNPFGGCRGLYVAIATALGATPRFHKAEAINQAAALLAAEEHERHRRVIFVIDEAHLLTPEQLEEIRLLSNAELDSASPFAAILLGQPTLAARLRQGIFAAYVARPTMSRVPRNRRKLTGEFNIILSFLGDPPVGANDRRHHDRKTTWLVVDIDRPAGSVGRRVHRSPHRCWVRVQRARRAARAVRSPGPLAG